MERPQNQHWAQGGTIALCTILDQAPPPLQPAAITQTPKVLKERTLKTIENPEETDAILGF